MPKLKKKSRNVIKLKDTLKMAFSYLNFTSQTKIIAFHNIFVMILVLSFATFSKATEVNEGEFLNSDRRMVKSFPININYWELLEMQTELEIERFYSNGYGQTIDSVRFDLYEQTTDTMFHVYSYNTVSKELLKEKRLYYQLEGEEGIIIDNGLLIISCKVSLVIICFFKRGSVSKKTIKYLG